MLWRGSRSITPKTLIPDLQLKCISLPAHSKLSPSFHVPSRELPAENPQLRFTGKISRVLLSKFPFEVAVLLSTIGELFVNKTSQDNILQSLQLLHSKADVLSNAKVMCELVQKLVQTACPDQAMYVLHVAHHTGLVLRHNQYENIAYQLAIRNYWGYLQVVTTMARKMTGSWTVRLFNWALRSYIETKDYSRFNTALAEFDRHQLTPTRRSYHLLVEGHLRNSDLNRARDALVRMQASGFEMNQSTYSIVHNAYRSLGPNEAVEAQAFQALQGTGEPSDTAILNSLMKTRIADGDIVGALRILKLFSLSPLANHEGGGNDGSGVQTSERLHTPPITSSTLCVVPNNATFNILLMLLARHQGELRNVLSVFRQMTAVGLHPDVETVTALVVAYSTANMTGAALSLVYEACLHNNIPVDKNEFILLGCLSNTTEVDLHRVLSVYPTVTVFNALLRAILPEKGLVGMRRLLRIMRQASILPDASTTQIIITYLHNVHYHNPRSLIRLLDTLTGFPTYESSLTVHQLNAILSCLIGREIDSIRTSGWNASAQRVRFGHDSRLKSPRLFHAAQKFDPTAGIALRSFPRRISKPFDTIVESLSERQVMSDRTTFALRIRRDAVVKLDMESAQRAFDVMVARGIHPNAYHYSALIEGYAALGNMREAKSVMFRARHAGVKPNVIIYTILIKGFGRLGQPELAKRTFAEMVADGVKPDFAAVDAVVSAYWFVKAYKSARNLLLDLWPLVAPFPAELQDAPLRELVQYLRDHRGTTRKTIMRPIESHQERRRRMAVTRLVNRTLTDLKQWQRIEEAVTWAKADIGLEYMIQGDASNKQNKENDDWS